MIATEKLQTIVRDHGEVVDTSGNKIGKVGQLYLDDQTGDPEWVTVMTGLFGMSESFVPIRDATLEGDHVRVPYDKDMVKDAPRIDADAHLDERQEDELYNYYHLEGTTGDRTDMRSDMQERSDVRGKTDDAMTRSEEELRVGKERHATGHAHLRKYVVTENVQTTVPVSHEEVRVVREPITDENIDEALSGPDITESEHEVTLHAETPVVEKTTKPVERVRLEKDEVTEQEQVNETVRKEKIESDVDDTRRDRGM
ncbi:PRC and DUF2382 domain-containing protein [Cryobacterium sp. BB736]|uniref:PRC and DUF2382 domain-containing protein n=1 Tax=Cryobacterium sp. BB736 TaxID=2746963 RepID=UPI001874CF8B|nr:PRC and DUF2382 domain-containing protein [Cryobacterium sp. BB736]